LGHLNVPPELLTAEVRLVIDEQRQAILSGYNGTTNTIEAIVESRFSRLVNPSLRRVINATGVVLHTNLGRAPLVQFDPESGYSNLEYDLETGKRGKRDEHTSRLLEALLGSPAIVVNNNAAAVYLVLNELAAGREVVVSRGELIEIGDGFRIPEIMMRAGVTLREVGTTNRTRIDDYSSALGEGTALFMRVHPSNFHIRGFASRPEIGELANLGKQHGIPVYEDLGSGCVVDLSAFGVAEPLVSESLQSGVDIVSFSGDKLLGGPQCGIIAGKPELVARMRRNPMYRALRVDKLITQALEITVRNLLLQNWSAVPVMRMIMSSEADLKARAERVAGQIKALETRVRPGKSPIGGGSTPDQELSSWLIELLAHNAAELERRLRCLAAPVIARIERDLVILDMRTVSDEEEAALAAAVNEACS
jgi:L-seryl-tRNA(Ser) seleniumtransferase